MSMLLTISQPPHLDFGGRTTHDFSPRLSLAKSRVSPKPFKVDSPVSSLRVSATPDDHKMSTPHRGLPPPAAMTLPDPGRNTLPGLNQPLGAMPAPPHQWQGQEESMRNWLFAKAEEDKRKQEEEKTRQEGYKLEQRKIEQSMLRESLQAGVPPTMVPMIYAGVSGSQLSNISLEMLQHYAAQLQVAQQQLQQQISSEPRRDARPPAQQSPPYPLPQQQAQVVPSQPMDTQQAPLQTTFSAYQSMPTRPPPTSAPRSAAQASLPRLTTNEMHVYQPPQGGPGSAHPLQQSQTIHPDQTSSPSIYFHHWVPPSESKSTQPQTPASRGGEPLSAHPGSHLSENDYKESPRKRKAQGAQQPAPPPPGPPQTSPPFSTTSSGSGPRRGHVRSRSGASFREGDSSTRPTSRREPELPQTLLRQESSETHSTPDSQLLSAGTSAPPAVAGAQSSTEARRDALSVERSEARGGT